MLCLLPLLFLLQLEGSAAGDCTRTNDFEYTECGSGDAKECCSPLQACVTAKDSTGDNDVVVCSAERRLWGERVIYIILIPLLGSILTIVMAGYSFKGIQSAPMQGGGKAVSMVCLVVGLISWPLYLSQYWSIGLYSFFLSLLTIASAQWTDRVWWLYRLVWIMQVFQIIAFFGAYEAFHVPFFRFSSEESSGSSGSSWDWSGSSGSSWDSSGSSGSRRLGGYQVALSFSYDQATCSKYYGSYFDMLPIEIAAHKADDTFLYFGLCTKAWLGCIHLDLIIVGILWMVICALSTPVLMAADPGKAARMSMGQAAVPTEVQMEENKGAEPDGEHATLVGKQSE